MGSQLDEVAFIGDDLNDLPALECVGLPCAVADAAAPVKAIAHYVTEKRGGDGAVREVCELLIAAQAVTSCAVVVTLAGARSCSCSSCAT